MRACKELGIETVAVYSDADRDLLHLRYADETVCIGPAASADSYLNIPALIAAAEIADVEAIHPGYGFLSENAHFVEVCQSCNIKFIGPVARRRSRSSATRSQARELARRPTCRACRAVTGRSRPSARRSRSRTFEIGFPVLIKAAAGGGGRGMRVAHNDESLDQMGSTRPGPRPRPRSRTRRSTSRSSSTGRGTSRSRSSATSTATSSTSASATARCSGGTRSWSKRAPARCSIRRCARRDGRGRDSDREGRQLPLRGHRRVPARQGGQLLLHRGQRPDPGRAPGDRGGDGDRPDPGDDPDRRGERLS